MRARDVAATAVEVGATVDEASSRSRERMVDFGVI